MLNKPTLSPTILILLALTCLIPVGAKEMVILDEKPAASGCAPPVESINRSAENLSPPAVVSADCKENFCEKRPHLILAFGGGGCKAIAQIGVLRSLEKHHIPIDGIVGTSMGATIGALYCAGIPLNEIENLFVEGKVQKAMLSHIVLKVMAKPMTSIAYFVVPKPYAGLVSGNALLHLLEKKLPPSFTDLKKPFAAVTTNLTDGQTCVLGEGNLPKAVLASNAVPPVYRPVLIDGKLYIDGGLKANLPSNIAQRMGADIVISVVVDKAVTPESNEKFKSIKAIVARTTDIMLAEADKQHAKSSDILIYPNVDNVKMITRNTNIIEEGIAAGEKAADEVCTQISRELLVEHNTNQRSTEISHIRKSNSR